MWPLTTDMSPGASTDRAISACGGTTSPIFFFRNGGKSCLISLIKKKFWQTNLDHQKVDPENKSLLSRHYTNQLLGTPMTQRRASSLIFATTTFGIEEVFRKTLAFLSLQISQTVSMRIDVIAFFLWTLEKQICSHHSLTVSKVDKSSKTHSGSSIQAFSAAQNRDE